MPRKKKDNYHQVCGRPHSGLEDPEKFGLTYEEVLDLIDKGEWRRFYHNWIRRQNRAKLPKKPTKFQCKCCKGNYLLTEEHITIQDTVKICEKCVEKLNEQQLARNKGNGEDSKATEGEVPRKDT